MVLQINLNKNAIDFGEKLCPMSETLQVAYTEMMLTEIFRMPDVVEAPTHIDQAYKTFKRRMKLK
jgi:hypothetical protein